LARSEINGATHCDQLLPRAVKLFPCIATLEPKIGKEGFRVCFVVGPDVLNPFENADDGKPLNKWRAFDDEALERLPYPDER